MRVYGWKSGPFTSPIGKPIRANRPIVPFTVDPSLPNWVRNLAAGLQSMGRLCEFKSMLELIVTYTNNRYCKIGIDANK